MAEENRIRKKQFLIHLMKEEMELLESKSENAGMTKTEFIRNIITFGNTSSGEKMDKQDIKQWLYELNRIGNNINQIAYHVNYNSCVGENDFEQLKDEYIRILGLFEDIAFGR